MEHHLTFSFTQIHLEDSLKFEIEPNDGQAKSDQSVITLDREPPKFLCSEIIKTERHLIFSVPSLKFKNKITLGDKISDQSVITLDKRP